jgi:hypothetical protein
VSASFLFSLFAFKDSYWNEIYYLRPKKYRKSSSPRGEEKEKKKKKKRVE